jgi:hypothetical protein
LPGGGGAFESTDGREFRGPGRSDVRSSSLALELRRAVVSGNASSAGGSDRVRTFAGGTLGREPFIREEGGSDTSGCGLPHTRACRKYWTHGTANRASAARPDVARLTVMVSRFAFAFAVVGVFVGAITACSTGEVAAPAPSADSKIQVTYYRDVLPILQRSCQGCHVEGGIAPFALSTYENAKNTAADIVDMTSARKMPPWGAFETAECTPTHKIREDLRLSDLQIDTLRSWLAGGTLEGSPNDAPPPPPPRVTGLPNAELELLPQSEFRLTATTDQFRCFVLDPKITETKFLNGTFFIPGNPRIVHHALLFTDPQRESLTKAGPDGSYDCFGSARTTGGSLVAAWAPGGVPQQFPENVGSPILANTLFVMQVHYHPHNGAPPDPDLTKVQIRFTKAPPEWLAITRLIGNFNGPFGAAPDDGLLPGPSDPPTGPAFAIPANSSRHRETMQVTIPATSPPKLYVYGVGAHMHYVGVDERITLLHKTPAAGVPPEECLLQNPRWDFNWQRGYAFEGPLEELPLVVPGDRLRVRCTYDNTLSNPLLARALKEQNLTEPRDVKLGESTLDEMCIGAFVFLTKRAP